MTACRVCNGTDLELILDLGDQPHCNRLLSRPDEPVPVHPLRLHFCRTCTTVQIDHTIPRREMFSNYPYVSGTTETLRAHFNDSAERLSMLLGLGSGDLVIDIGSNDGTWLRSYRHDLHLRTIGVEPARNLVAMARESGVCTVDAFFDHRLGRDIYIHHGPARLVTAAGVFFHLEDLHGACEGVKILIQSGGTLCVQAMYLGDIVENTAFDAIYHEHLTYWTLRSLGELLCCHEMEVYDVRHLPIHGGTVEYLVGLTGEHTVELSVRTFLDGERDAGLYDVCTYHAFAEQVWCISTDLRHLLQRYQVSGKVVHALGAPAKGATLLNSFKIGTDLVPVAVEVNPLKVGRYIPGVGTPILDEASTPIPDAYLVLAWNFLPELLRKKRSFIEAGGEFIVAIPSPYIVDKENYGRLTT